MARLVLGGMTLLLGLMLATGASAQDSQKNQSKGVNQSAQGAIRPSKSDTSATVAQKEKKLPYSDITLPRPATASDKTKQQLAGRVNGILKEKVLSGKQVGIRVVDLDSGDVIYSHNDTAWLKPASNTKLVTTAAAMSLFGPDYQFVSELLVHGKVEKGVVKGDLQLYIDHDFTWGIRFYERGDVPLVGMIEQLKAAGIKKIEGKVIVSGYVVYGGVPTGTLSASAHLNKVANVFTNLLKKNNISFAGMVVGQNAKREGKTVATWKSPTLSEAIAPLNRVSHNEYADMLMLALGAKDSGKNTYAAGAAAVKKWLKKNNIPMAGFSMNDGSGLSHDNRMSATFFTTLVSKVMQSSYAREWAASMSVSGHDGTFGGRLNTEDSRGRVYAKSGTLRDTFTASGFFVNKYDGHTYAFSVLVNGTSNKQGARGAIDRIVRVFMGNHLGVKPVQAPVFVSFRKESDGRVMARWDGVKDALGYRVYQSNDGTRWKVAAETKDTVLTMPNTASHLRVTAVMGNGNESAPSLIFSYRPGKKVMTIVDESRCRSDESMRPVNHLIAHERPLATFVDGAWGVETVRKPTDSKRNGLLYHSVACNGNIAWDSKAYSKAASSGIPVVVNVINAHQSEASKGMCAPESGNVLGCYMDGISGVDRRVGKSSLNYRQRRGIGSESSRPTGVHVWKGASSLYKMNGIPVVAQKKTVSGGSVNIVGIDLQAMDSQRSLDAIWNSVMK